METRQRRADASEKSARSFPCSHPGCDKRFSRYEHQRRHEYNHGIGQSTCPRCSAHFKRPDLLDRHLKRHREKDEAGAVLNTRKRSWKAPDGSIVPQKPTFGQQISDQQSTLQGRAAQHQEAPISPPSSTGNDEAGQFQEFQFEQDVSSVLWPSISGVGSLPESHSTVQENFWIEPGLLPPSLPTTSQQFDDIFQPDTASSFNMPYTTAANYQFLFGITDFGTSNNQGTMDIDPDTSSNVVSPALDSEGSHNRPSHQDFNVPNTIPTIVETANDPHRPPSSSTAIGNDHNLDSISFTSARLGRDARNSAPTTAHPSPARNFGPLAGKGRLERPLSTLQVPSHLPLLLDDARERLLELIDIAQPVLPTGQLNAWDHPLLSSAALQQYLELYFTRFNVTYPLIHRATFDVNDVEPLFLLSILLLGATYSKPEAHQLAVCIHDKIRPLIFAHADFGASPQLWCLKTILLVECFGKSRAGQKQHDMSHLFHGLLINLIRRSDCQTIQTSQYRQWPADGKDLVAHWRQWAEAEEKKRLALLCFMWDTQHAVLFCQSLCMSAFELRLSLPCSQSLWEANDASAWQTVQNADSTTEISYLSALKFYLYNPDSQQPPNLNVLSRILILHGLMSISWDLERRDQTALGVVNFVGGVNWRDKLSEAYDCWKKDFDLYSASYCCAMKQREQSETSRAGAEDWKTIRQEFATFSTAYNAVFHAAQILINSSFLDVQIYAGSRHILGRPIRRGDFLRSEKVIKRWASGQDQAQYSSNYQRDSTKAATSARAAWHAAAMLSDASSNLDNFDSMGIFHVPWCLYLATLTLWAFNHARPGNGDGYDEEGNEMVWDAKREMNDLLLAMTSAQPWNLEQTRRRATGGLVWVIAEALTQIRWGIVHSGVLVLKALIPMRLIGQYESA